MTLLKHELWLDEEGHPTLCLSGRRGEGVRRRLGKNALLLGHFEAGSPFEAMHKYYEQMGWRHVPLDDEWDLRPYPANWLDEQKSSL